MDEIKTLIRKKYKNFRNAITSAEKTQFDSKIIESLLPIVSDSNKISIYFPIQSEIDLLPLFKILANKILFPRIESNILSFVSPSNLSSDFEYNPKYKIYEPRRKNLTFIPEIIICPMLSFDKNKNRLGYGGGFYDRTIALLRKKHKIKFIGVAYDIQEHLSLPTSSQDQRLDIIVTPNRIL